MPEYIVQVSITRRAYENCLLTSIVLSPPPLPTSATENFNPLIPFILNLIIFITVNYQVRSPVDWLTECDSNCLSFISRMTNLDFSGTTVATLDTYDSR